MFVGRQKELETRHANNKFEMVRRVDLEPVKRSTFCDALEKRDYHIYESIFYSLVDLSPSGCGQ